MNEKPLNVWVIVEEDGSILTANCTCMAGISEVCSHVGAVLYAIENAYSKSESVSCTDVKATWPVPSTSKITNVPVAEMEWGKKHQKAKEKECHHYKDKSWCHLCHH